MLISINISMLIPVEKARDVLINILGYPDDIDRLDEYLEFVYTNEYKGTELYAEDHHIIPRCLLENEHIVRLKYNDHCNAHLLLFLAFNINKLQKTLNFMKPTMDDRLQEDYKKAVSLSRKKGWEKFKSDEERYRLSCEANSIRTSERMRNGQAKAMADKRYSKDEAREEISKMFKRLWQDDEYKERVIQSMVEERNSPEGKARMRKAAQNTWDNKTDKQREEFTEKMTLVNQDINKRNAAGEKIKAKWADDEFRNKMLKRPKRSKEKNKEHSNTMKEKWKDPSFREMMLSKRKESRESKLKNETK